jgi:hypothetical protein
MNSTLPLRRPGWCFRCWRMLHIAQQVVTRAAQPGTWWGSRPPVVSMSAEAGSQWHVSGDGLCCNAQARRCTRRVSLTVCCTACPLRSLPYPTPSPTAPSPHAHLSRAQNIVPVARWHLGRCSDCTVLPSSSDRWHFPVAPPSCCGRRPRCTSVFTSQ